VAVIGSFKLKLWFSWWIMVKLEMGWTLRWKWEDHQLGRSESGM
jgi:hypothetical protein